MPVSAREIEELTFAKELLENPGIAAKVTNLLGTPIEKGIERLPDGWQESVNKATRIALDRALQLAIDTMGKEESGKQSENFWHKFAVAASGGVGGAFGIAALAIELPVSTTIMLRSIADIARNENEDLSTPASQLACIEVFALGGPTNKDDAVETGYYATRIALAHVVGKAAGQVAAKGAGSASSSHVTKLITSIAERFGTQVTEKMIAQLIPAIGAAGGAIINTLFMDHFQKIARGHFIIRRLERSHGFEVVQKEYEKI